MVQIVLVWRRVVCVVCGCVRMLVFKLGCVVCRGEMTCFEHASDLQEW